jgi:hypothetical protein
MWTGTVLAMDPVVSVFVSELAGIYYMVSSQA